MSKPKLGKVSVGDRLLVLPTSYGRRAPEPVEVVVTKAARIWIDLEEIDQVRSFRRTWRMRLDTQTDGGNGSYHDRFVTAEQLAWEQRVRAADAYLSEAGIRLDTGTPWRPEDRRITLANLLRQHDGLPEL